MHTQRKKQHSDMTVLLANMLQKYNNFGTYANNSAFYLCVSFFFCNFAASKKFKNKDYEKTTCYFRSDDDGSM